MRIDSDDKASFIELERRDEGGFLVLAASTSILEFTARNRSIIISDAPAFLRDMPETASRPTAIWPTGSA